MASRVSYDVMYPGRREVRLLGCKIYPQGTGTPLLDTDPPDGGSTYPVTGRPVRVPGIASVVRTSTGLYTVTLQDKYAGLVAGLGPDLHLHTLTQLVAQFTTVDVAGAKTVGIQVFNPSTGAATDVSAAADNWIAFLLVLANSLTN